MAEISSLLGLITDDQTRQALIAQMENMFDNAPDEERLIQEIGNPTKVAVALIRYADSGKITPAAAPVVAPAQAQPRRTPQPRPRAEQYRPMTAAAAQRPAPSFTFPDLPEDEAMERLWEAILNMFENDHSAARGKMAVRELIVFKHDTELGCAPAHKLFDLVKAARKEGVTAPRGYEDYTVTVVEDELPDGVTCTRMG